MVFGKRANAMQGRDDRNAGPLGQLTQLGERTGELNAASRQDQRLLGIVNQLDRFADLATIALIVGLIAGQINLIWPLWRGARYNRILGNVHQHRTRPATARDVKRFFHHIRDVVNIGDQIVMLGNRLGNAGNIRLLERVLADKLSRNLARNGNHRHAVHHRIGNGGDEICRARATCGHTHTNLAGRAGIAFSRMSGCLLMADEHMVQRRILRQSMVKGHDCPTRIAKHDLDAFADERLAHDLSATSCF